MNRPSSDRMPASAPAAAPGSMTLPAFIEDLGRRGITLSIAEGERISYAAPAGALLDADRAYINTHRPRIRTFLLARLAARRPPLTRASGISLPSFSQELWWERVRTVGEPLASDNVRFSIYTDAHDTEKITRALIGVVTRHEVLRSRFKVGVDGLEIEFNAPETLPIQVRFTRDLAEADALARDFATSHVAMMADWLMVAGVFATPVGTVIALCIHHSIFDGGSEETMRCELLASIYAEGGSPGLGDRLQFRDVSLWERTWFLGDAGRRLDDYWSAWAERIPKLHTPSGKPLTWTEGPSTLLRFPLSAATTNAVEAAAEVLDAPTSALVIAALTVSLARWSGQNNFALRVAKDARSSLELEGLVGPVLTHDPIEARVLGTMSLHAFIGGQQAEGHIARELSVPNHVYPTPTNFFAFHQRIGVTFNFHKPRGLGRKEKPTLNERAIWPAPPAWERLENAPRGPMTPIYFRTGYMGDELHGEIACSNAVVQPEEQTALLGTYLRILEQITAEPHQLLGSL